MRVSGVPGSAATDPAVALALAALELQAEGLGAVSYRLVGSRALVPASADDTWQGPARLAYEAGLSHLGRVLRAAESSVDEALSETRRAAATLRQEIG